MLAPASPDGNLLNDATTGTGSVAGSGAGTTVIHALAYDEAMRIVTNLLNGWPEETA